MQKQHVAKSSDRQSAGATRALPPQATLNKPYGPQSALQALQNTAGNQAVLHLLGRAQPYATLQTKLKVNEAGDRTEVEADQIADAMLASPVQPTHNGSAPSLQRYTAPTPTAVATAPASVERVLASAGMPLNPMVQQEMEQRFGHDFSPVRIHTGSAAAQSANDVNALAYTVNQHIVFGAGQFAPATTAGRRLLAHELAHVLQQTAADTGRNTQRTGVDDLSASQGQPTRASVRSQSQSHEPVISRKCDVEAALTYYQKTAQGKKINYTEWLDKLHKVVGSANQALYDAARAAGKIDHAFVLLVCKGQQLLKVPEDGKIGELTAAAFDQFATGGKKGIDYGRLFKDKKLEVGIAIGDEFSSEFTAIVTLLETAGKSLKNYSSSGGVGSKRIKFTKEFPTPGDNTAAPVAIDVVFNIISAQSKTPKKTYSEFLSTQEIVIYSGHARYGTGPDFDEKKSVKENFIIGVNAALHKTGKLKRGYDAHMNEILKGYSNDLEAMSKAGKFDPDKYQVWFFNACSSINYLDEVRKGLVTDKAGQKKTKANLRFVGTTESIYSDALQIVQSILAMNSMDQIIRLLDANEKAIVTGRGEKANRSYYFSD